MNIKEYKFNNNNVSNFSNIVTAYEESYNALCEFIDTSFAYNSELFELYQNYMMSLNNKMFCFKDFVKYSYDRIDSVKAIFEGDDNLRKKIGVCLVNLENVFETYDYMCERIDTIQQDYSAAFAQYQADNSPNRAKAINMRAVWENITAFHYDAITKIGEFVDSVAEPQLSIADALYEKELDFNKALNLVDNASASQM